MITTPPVNEQAVVAGGNKPGSDAALPLKGVAGKHFYPQLNGLRFVFIFMVLLHHWGPPHIFKAVRLGWLGVDLFFVLSGFLIGEILLVEKERNIEKITAIRNFIIRRALRIFPLYYITIIIYSLLAASGGIFLWNITYTNNILQLIDISKVPAEFLHLWSLCVEEQYYLFFPFLVFFLKRKNFLILVVAGILFSVVGRFVLIFSGHSSLFYALMPFCLDSLFMGALLAYLKTFDHHLLKKILARQLIIYPLIVLFILGIFLVSLGGKPLPLFTLYRFIGSAAGFLIIGYSVIFSYGGLLKKFLENRWISLLGKISYGIYLLHPFVEALYLKHASGNSIKMFLVNLHLPLLSNRYIIDFLFLFPVTIIISWLSFQLIEKRFLKLKSLYSS